MEKLPFDYIRELFADPPAIVMVTVYSTQMIEAACFDLPIINAGYYPLRESEFPISVYEEFDHIRRITATGGVTNCHSKEELIAAVNADLAERGRLAEGRRRLADQEVPVDSRGHSGSTIARRIVELAEG